MKLSDAGLAFIQEFEGYHTKLPDGSCKAYRCQIGNGMDDGKWTIGFGCTEGVYGGLVWTRAQADEAFRRELARFEEAVGRCVTASVTQNQFDALVSFSYNCGESALAHSTVLSRTNAGDPEGAARAFGLWNKSRGQVVSGLVRRRAAEAAMYSRPDLPSAEPEMPQTVDVPSGGDVHEEAHASLMDSSTLYSMNRVNIKSITACAAGAMAFLQEHAMEIAAAGLVAVILFEGVQYAMRSKRIAG